MHIGSYVIIKHDTIIGIVKSLITTYLRFFKCPHCGQSLSMEERT